VSLSAGIPKAPPLPPRRGLRPVTRAWSLLAAAVAAALLFPLGVAPAASAAPAPGQSAAGPVDAVNPVDAQPGHWVSTWSAAPTDMGNYDYTGTVRNIVFSSVGGNTVRVRLSNTFGSQAYEFGAVSIGISDAQGNITGPVVPLTFNGQQSVTVPQGAEVVSDPASLTVPPLHDLAVSVYVPYADGEQTGHPDAQQVNYLTEGTDNVMDRTTAAFGQLSQWYYVDSVDVTTTPRVAGTVVALGDSITDGYQSTVNANTRWPNDLARRLDALHGATMSVADEGISANQVLAGGGQAGVSALSRFNRDVVARAGVKDVILLEGINDIGLSSASASQIIAGYQQLIAGAHAAGLKIFGGTLTPFKGSSYWTPARQRTWDVLNRWIRTSGAFDGVIDFARATADPSDPEMFYPPYDSGDHLHPNDAGYQAMANAVSLAMLLHPTPAPPAIGYLPSYHAVVAPGGSTTVRVAASNTTSRPQVAHVRLTPPAGLTVTPGSVNITVPPNGRSTALVKLRAAPSTPQTFYPVRVAFSGDARAEAGGPPGLTVLVARPGSLLRAFNNTGISGNSDISAADFDQAGHSYSAQTLAAAGLSPGKRVTVNGVGFSWPAPDPGYPDNAIAQGQRVVVNAPAGTRTLGFLGSASGGGASQGIATLHYSDGTTAQFMLGLSDWALNEGASTPSYGNQAVATMPYANCDTCARGQDLVNVYVFYAGLPVDPGKRLVSVTLPATVSGGEMHIFAVGTGTQAMTPPAAQSVNPATASAGQVVTVTGTGFGAAQGSGYVDFTSNGNNWGAPGSPAVQIDSWSDTAVAFTVPAASGTSGEPGAYPGTPASVTVVTSGGAATDSPVMQIAPTADPADYYDNISTSPDSDQACANYDGLGYSYSATGLANAGLTPGATLTADGLTFTWPNAAPCAPDNILAAGQTMLVNGTAGQTTLGLLGSATNGGSQGTIVINYTDGTSSTGTVSFNDWAGGPGNGDTAVATMPYRNSNSGSSQTLNMYIYATTVQVNPAKTVASVVLPGVSNSVGAGVAAMHIFALALGS
jgi:lysophospholipase L1-like esterase